MEGSCAAHSGVRLREPRCLNLLRHLGFHHHPTSDPGARAHREDQYRTVLFASGVSHLAGCICLYRRDGGSACHYDTIEMEVGCAGSFLLCGLSTSALRRARTILVIVCRGTVLSDLAGNTRVSWRAKGAIRMRRAPRRGAPIPDVVRGWHMADPFWVRFRMCVRRVGDRVPSRVASGRPLVKCGLSEDRAMPDGVGGCGARSRPFL